METRFTPQPTPKSFRPNFIQEEAKKPERVIIQQDLDEPPDRLLGRFWKWSLVIFSLFGFSVSTASLFATLLLHSDVSENFGGVIGLFLKTIELNYGQTGIMFFWVACLVYFFLVAYRSATRL